MPRIQLEHQLVTAFHRQLATPEWLSQLAESVESLDWLEGPGRVSSDYNEDSFMGPQSVVKYRFQILFEEPLPSESPIRIGTHVYVNYRPGEQTCVLGSQWYLA